MEFSQVSKGRRSKPLYGRLALGWLFASSGIIRHIGQRFLWLNGSLAILLCALIIEFLFKRAGSAQRRLSTTWQRLSGAIMQTPLLGFSLKGSSQPAAVMISPVRFAHSTISLETRLPSDATRSTWSESETVDESFKAETATVTISRLCFVLFWLLSVIESGLAYAVTSRVILAMCLSSALVLAAGSLLIRRRRATGRGSGRTLDTTAVFQSSESE